MKRKIILISVLLIIIIALVAAYTKPDDKTITEKAVQAVWGNLTPGKYN